MDREKTLLDSARHLPLLLTAMVLVTLSTLGAWLFHPAGNRVLTRRDTLTALSSRLEGLDDLLANAARGDPDALGRIGAETRGADNAFASAATIIPPGKDDTASALDTAIGVWKPLSVKLKDLAGGSAPGGRVDARAGTERLIDLYRQIAARLASAAPDRAALANEQLGRLNDVHGLAATLAGAPPTEAAQVAERLAGQLRQVAATQQRLAEPVDGNNHRDPATEALLAIADAELGTLLDAARPTPTTSPTGLRSTLASVRNDVADARAAAGGVGGIGGPLASLLTLASLLGALTLLAVVAYAIRSGNRRTQRLIEEREARQQQAILNLLDEITNFANGDLTVDVTVTEDFTGAIADSINYTVQTLRGLVGTINQTSSEIALQAAGSQDTARVMSEVSDRQTREINQAAQSMTAASQSLQQVAGKASELATDARASVQMAHTGNETVARTVQNMSALREQIQDTSKRIKRLGESSQEIGDIVELINDIAEQTSTLALNASIQAAMAGESGRGFAVVADEVQRLSERAANATRQIETLIRTIQTDTSEAIVSMERSTANVVSGSRLSEEAGQALGKIENTSQGLARLMQEISVSAQAESERTTRLAGTMQGIRQVSLQALGSAEKTAQSVDVLNTLSAKLRDSVAGFKLPTTDSLSQATL